MRSVGRVLFCFTSFYLSLPPSRSLSLPSLPFFSSLSAFALYYFGLVMFSSLCISAHPSSPCLAYLSLTPATLSFLLFDLRSERVLFVPSCFASSFLDDFSHWVVLLGKGGGGRERREGRLETRPIR